MSQEIVLEVDGLEVASGGAMDFGMTNTGTPVAKTVVIRNDGDAQLLLDPGAISVPAGYTIVEGPAHAVLDPGVSTFIVLELAADSQGNYSGDFALPNDDADENPYVLRLSGVVVDPSPLQIDDGSPGFSSTGAWNMLAGGNDGDSLWTNPHPVGTHTATWTFQGLPDGVYDVYVTWKIVGAQSSLMASNALYTVTLDGSGPVTALVNQRVPPSGGLFEGVPFKKIVRRTVTNGNLSVQLTNKANGRVSADAVQLVRI